MLDEEMTDAMARLRNENLLREAQSKRLVDMWNEYANAR